jgi:glycerophosphoryl diester phosphodiesterase
MEGRRTLGLAGLIAAIALLAAVVMSPSAGAVSPNPNPWLQKHFLVMAHQGGEDEAPSNTMFALKSSLRDRGADSLELDVNLAADDPENSLPARDRLMVIHDDTWTRIACTPLLCQGDADSQHRPGSQVNQTTVEDLQKLDAGYWFRPGTYSHNYSLPDSAYPYRGMRTGDVTPPAGYSATDFEIPTLKQVLETFPNIPINVEIKMIKTSTAPPENGGCVTDNGTQYCDDPDASIPVADAVADLLNHEPQSVRDNVIVVSFSDELLDEFHQQDDTPKVALAGATNGTTNFVLAGTIPDPDVAAFQVPPKQLGFDVPNLLLGLRNAHGLGYAVHVWTNGDQDETDASYAYLYGLGVDGIMSSDPSRLAAWLCANHVPRPDGTSRGPGCAAPVPGAPAPTPKKKHKCKKAKKHKSKRASEAKKKKCKKHKKKR